MARIPGGFDPSAPSHSTSSRPAHTTADFAESLREYGLVVPMGDVRVGQLTRVQDGREDRGRAGWYVLHAAGERLCGAYGSWKRGDDCIRWPGKEAIAQLSPEEQVRLNEAIEEARKQQARERKRRAEEAAFAAAKLWNKSQPPSVEHPYLQAKGIQPNGTRVDAEGWLLVPVRRGRELVGLQRIAPDGTKRFLPGTPVKGAGYLLGEPGPVLGIAEGFATAASVHEVTGLPVLAAFNAGNLTPAARQLRQDHPGARLVIYADNDHESKGNVGIEKARSLAAETGAEVIAPPPEPGISDWNDYAQAHGVMGLMRSLTRPLDLPDRLERDADALKALGGLRADSFSGQPVPERQWLINHWMPMQQTTLLFGDGGLGKSLLALQLAVAVASGNEWLGLEVDSPGPALVLSCEDDADEMHRRLHGICEGESLDIGSLSQLVLLPRVGEDNALMRFDGQSVGALTLFWEQLLGLAKEVRPKLIVLDTAADLFAGNENVRQEVRQFIQRACTGIAQEVGCAVVLLAHPSRAGMQTGTGDSGSTAWSNSVRQRLYLTREEEHEPLLLKNMKSNYGPTGGELQVQWTDGRMVLAAAGATTAGAQRELALEELILDTAERFESTGQPFSPHAQSRAGAYAGRVIVELTRRSQRYQLSEVEAAIVRLQAEDYLAVEHPSRGPARLVRTTKQRGNLIGRMFPTGKQLHEKPEEKQALPDNSGTDGLHSSDARGE